MDPYSTTSLSTSSSSAPSTESSTSSHIKRYRPYFAPSEVERLSAKQRGKLSVAREERGRQQACGFIDAVGVRCGFPRKTIATAQMLYIRFHLFFPYKDFNYMEVSLSTLYVSSKLHDTLKKPRDIILASYPIRFPHLLAKKGTIDPSAIDQAALETERSRVLGIERLVLESICFRLGVGGGLSWVIKLGKKMGLNKESTMQAWRAAIDCYRTPAPISYPPHAIALGSIYAAALLSGEESRPSGMTGVQNGGTGLSWLDVTGILSQRGRWEDDYRTTATEVDAIAHAMLDLHITILSTPTSDPQHALTPSPSSPRDTPVANLNPLAPSGTTSNGNSTSGSKGIANTAFRLPSYWTVQTLTELKVWLRERASSQGIRVDMLPAAIGDSEGSILAWDGSAQNPLEGSNGRSEADDSQGLGQNDGTTRFVWDQGVIA